MTCHMQYLKEIRTRKYTSLTEGNMGPHHFTAMSVNNQCENCRDMKRFWLENQIAVAITCFSYWQWWFVGEALC